MNPSKTSLSQALKLLTKHNINNPELLQDLTLPPLNAPSVAL